MAGKGGKGGKSAGRKRLAAQAAKTSTKRSRFGAEGVVVCRACHAQKACDNWPASVASSSRASEDTPADQCLKCQGLHRFSPRLSWEEFADKYQNDPEFRQRQDSAYEILQGRAQPTHSQAERRSHFRVGFRLERSVLALTSDELRLETDHKGDIKLLKAPLLNIPGLGAALHTNQALYGMLDSSMPYRRVTIFAEKEIDAEAMEASTAKDIFEGQARDEVIHMATEEATKLGLDVLVGAVPSLEEIQENAHQGEPGAPIGKKRGGRAATGATTTGVVARGSLEGVEQLGGAPEQSAASSASGNLAMNILAGNFVPMGDHDCDLTSSVGGDNMEAHFDNPMTPRTKQGPQSVAGRSSALQISPGCKLTQDQIRKLPPHQKAKYWQSRFCLMSALQGEGDYRVNRQVEDMLQRYAGTTDEVLASALAILRARYGQLTRAEQLAPSVVVNLDEGKYKEYVEEFVALEVVWPLKVQEGFVARKVKLLAVGEYPIIDCVAVITPWQLLRSQSGDDQLFDPLRPTVWALDAPESRKIEVFRSYFVFAVVKPLMERHDARHRILGFARDVHRAIDESIEDVELSEEIIDCVADVLDCTRALQLLLSEEVDVAMLKSLALASVGNFRLASQKRPESVCAQVHDMVAKHSEMSGLVAAFIKQEADMKQHATNISNAHHNLIGDPLPAGTVDCQLMLSDTLGSVLQWEMCLRKGAIAHISDALRRRIAEHAHAVVSDAGTSNTSSAGEPGPNVSEVMELVDRACKVWPLFEELIVLRDLCRKRHLQTFERSVFASLDSVLCELVAGLPKVGVSIVTFDEAQELRAQEAIAAIDGHLLPEWTQHMKALADGLLVRMNARQVWEEEIDMSPANNMFDRILNIKTADLETKQYYEMCWNHMQASYAIGEAFRSVASSGASNEEKYTSGGLGKLHTLRVALARLDKLRGSPVSLPSVAGDWLLRDMMVEEAKQFVSDAIEWLEHRAAANLDASVVELTPVCRGGAEGRAWCDGAERARSGPTWDQAAARLAGLDLPALELKIKKCMDMQADYTMLYEMLATPQDSVFVGAGGGVFES